MILPSLKVSILDENAEMTDLNKLRGEKAMVLDFWHTKCVKCPAALDKLNYIAEGDKLQVMFVACALSQGPDNRNLASDMITGTWENLVHVFMDIDVKEEAKQIFGFTSVPFVVLIDKDGAILGHGDPKSFDYMAMLQNASKLDITAQVPSTLVLDEDF